MKNILFLLFIIISIPNHCLGFVPTKVSHAPDTLCLGGSAGYFSFGLSSLYGEVPRTGIVYKWFLKGHDKEWHISGKGKRIHYAGLHPGNYLLTVRAFSRSYPKGSFQKELLVIVCPEIVTGKRVLCLYLFLLLLSVISVWIHGTIFRRRVTQAWPNKREGMEINELSYPVADLDFLEKVKRLVKEHCGDPHFTLSKFYKEIGMSRSAFNNKWKFLGQESLKSCICRARLEKAVLLLATTSLPISEVAQESGFCDAKYFREVFKSAFGIAPSEYRKYRRISGDKKKG